ncbi:MAG TPA: alpha/beta hydrolase, partial [Novosphingobium sp.]|nr:alpha/beta hydrolase [Novosphingobium sp.]
MAHSLEERAAVLTVPGLCGSGPGHWQSLWEEGFWALDGVDCWRADLGAWDKPR